ncbi:MAG: hypothetical protein JST62_07435 [Bacteroidetes bacterium]|nr:hypothetical protein [Bacteroidota bacterium]
MSAKNSIVHDANNSNLEIVSKQILIKKVIVKKLELKQTRYTFITTCGKIFSVVMSSGYSETQLFNLMNSLNIGFCGEEIDGIEIDG